MAELYGKGINIVNIILNFSDIFIMNIWGILSKVVQMCIHAYVCLSFKKRHRGKKGELRI